MCPQLHNHKKAILVSRGDVWMIWQLAWWTRFFKDKKKGTCAPQYLDLPMYDDKRHPNAEQQCDGKATVAHYDCIP